MITLLASLGGFLSSVFPQFIKYFIDKSDKKHELELMKMQISLHEKGISSRLEEIDAIRDLNQIKALYSTYKTGINWVDALNGTVRPVLAYSFFFLYASTKYLQFLSIKTITNFSALIEILWSIEDQAIFAGVISFYYGNRTINKIYNSNANK